MPGDFLIFRGRGSDLDGGLGRLFCLFQMLLVCVNDRALDLFTERRVDGMHHITEGAVRVFP